MMPVNDIWCYRMCKWDATHVVGVRFYVCYVSCIYTYRRIRLFNLILIYYFTRAFRVFRVRACFVCFSWREYHETSSAGTHKHLGEVLNIITLGYWYCCVYSSTVRVVLWMTVHFLKSQLFVPGIKVANRNFLHFEDVMTPPPADSAVRTFFPLEHPIPSYASKFIQWVKSHDFPQ